MRNISSDISMHESVVHAWELEVPLCTTSAHLPIITCCGGMAVSDEHGEYAGYAAIY